MAQYFHVLTQKDKSSDVSTQFYPNVEENQAVQYVLAPEASSQQFQPQSVVVSSDQLMVVDAQPQQVIIDPTQMAYTPPQYVIQDASAVEFQNNQQVFYMTNTPPTQTLLVDQSVDAQPVVLNHQIMQNHLTKVVNTTLPATCTTKTAQENFLRRNPMKTTYKPGIILNKAVSLQQSESSGVPKFPQNNVPVRNEVAKQQTVAMEDGSTLSVPQFRKLIAQKHNQLQGGKINSVLNSNILQRKFMKSAISTVAKPRMPRPRPQPRNKRPFVHNTNSEEYDSGSQADLKQNPQISSTVCDTTLLETHMQGSQNQYIIYPKVHENKPIVQRPLPEFLHSSQIQNIINSAPKNEEYTNSIRMLVLLSDGEQRLITFTLPKEPCTIQEILEQVGVPFTKETPIQVSQANAYGLNYIVSVGNIPGFSGSASESTIHSSESVQKQSSQVDKPTSSSNIYNEVPSPEGTAEVAPKLIEGQLAVCSYCGYLSEDFASCMRCRRKLPDNVKSMPALTSNGKKIDPRTNILDKRLALQKSPGIPRMNLLPKKRPTRSKLMECETVVVSSDEEQEDTQKSATKNVSEQILEQLGASVTISPISKEPSIIDIQKSSINALKDIDKVQVDCNYNTLILCRTVRIGSYRFVPPEPIRIDSNGLCIKVPHPTHENLSKVMRIENTDIVKVLCSFQKSLPVLFYYLLPSVGVTVRNTFDMVEGGDFYFDPLSEIEESHRRITLLPETLSEDSKTVLQKIYHKSGQFDELTYKEANDILIKTCPKELSRSVLNYSVSEIKPILMYPPEGRGKITINTEDYMCLGVDQFLNDVIIDFYLKYLLLNLPKEQQEKVHIFSTFFYKRLTTKPIKASRKSQPTELDPNLSPAQKRHSRVKTWTKNVNIFDKDFIIVPINENCHWFLAIICYPSMNGCETMDGQSIRIETKQAKKKKTAATKNKKVVQPIMCDDGEISDKDEAEGDDSELDSDDSEESSQTLSVENNDQRPPIKQPCILIFDSLAGASRSRVVATLRDYLTCEYKAKTDSEKIFTKDVIKGACPKVPQQTNFTDCGLYLLQYVEQFFEEPIRDYYIPISHLKTWFEEIVVTRKREEVSLLIQTLMKEAGKDLDILPEVIFPTLNGELTEQALIDKEDKFIDPDEDFLEEEEAYLSATSKEKKADTSSDSVEMADAQSSSPNKSYSPQEDEISDEILQRSFCTKSLISIDSSKSNRDTLSYLKAKRIVRHKNATSTEGAPDSKKFKNIDNT